MPDLIIISTRSDPIYFHQIIQISTCYVNNVFNTFEIPAALAFLPLITILTILPAAGITQELVSNPDVSLLHSSSLTCLNCPSSCTWTLRTCLLDYICTAVSSLPNPKQRTDVEQQGITWALTWWKRKSPMAFILLSIVVRKGGPVRENITPFPPLLLFFQCLK